MLSAASAPQPTACRRASRCPGVLCRSARAVRGLGSAVGGDVSAAAPPTDMHASVRYEERMPGCMSSAARAPAQASWQGMHARH